MSQTEFVWVVVYDIAEPRRQRQVKEILRYAGSQVRPCVYEVLATETGLRGIARQISPHLTPADGVRIYRLCEDCRARSLIFGGGSIAAKPSVVIV